MAFLVIITLWYLLHLMIDRPIIPSPFAVFWALGGSATKLLPHLAHSTLRIFVSIFIAVVIGFPLGIATGYYKGLDKFFSPILYFLYPLPKIAFLPIIMLLFGLGESSKIFILFIIIIFQITITVRDGVRSLDPKLYYPLIALDARVLDVFKHILIPASIPKLYSALRVALATSLSVLFFAETFGTTYGLGFYVMDAMMRINYIDMYCGIMTLSGLGIVLFAALDFFETIAVKWRESN